MSSITKTPSTTLPARTETRKENFLDRLHMAGLWYWSGFFAFNFLLFLPLYLLNFQDAAFLPSGPWQNILISRDNPDIFRFNLEISLLLLVFLLARPLWQTAVRTWYARAFFVVYLAALTYAIYESITLSLYHTSPVIYNDYRFFVGGIGFLIDGLRLGWWQLLLILGVIIAIPILLYKAIVIWFMRAPVERLGRWSRLVAWSLGLSLIGFSLIQMHALAQPATEVNSLGAKIIDNARASMTAREEVSAYDRIRPEENYSYAQTTRLIHKPNIYLIFVESYGSVLYKRSHFKDNYIALMQEMEARLEQDGWEMETALSTSPTWGGGSWMAYTSAEFGLHIGSQPQFLAVEDRFSREPYPSLGRYLQSQDYYYVRLAPIQRYIGKESEQMNDALYGPDRWIHFADLDYQGPLYGWGPAPPDQFSLNKARALVGDKSDQPLFFFYLTNNSHYPWAPLPSYPDDWRDLDDPALPSPPAISEPIPHSDNIKHYQEAIRYQWQTLSDFILSTSTEEDAIFVLVGDHQPPRVSRKNDGFETPIHIIARDLSFLRQFEVYGFEPGLVVSDLEPDMKHEGFYSMFVRELTNAYGTSLAPLPYFPDGIELQLSPHTPTPTPTPHTNPT